MELFFQYMTKTYILPEKNRKHLQEIWGQAVFGTEAQISQECQKIINDKKYKNVITVGDYCSHHLQSDIKIFDKKVQRQAFGQKHDCAILVSNPAGTIQKECWSAIKQAIEKKENICVDGEEDLLVIPAVLLAKPKTLVIYGFPNRGICLLEINRALKKQFREFIKNNFLIEKPG